MARTIEIVTFRLKPGVTDEQFVEATQVMEREALGVLPGFLDRDTGPSQDGDWVVVLHWESPEAAQNSMDKFLANPNTKPFMALVDEPTFKMKRYELKDHYQL